jgi:heme-degrading monooxygenase HmoA
MVGLTEAQCSNGGGRMFARTTTVIARQPGIDRGVRYIRDEVMPALQSIDGYVGTSILVDHATGRCVITSSWHSAQEMHASEPRVRPMRDRAIAAFDGLDSTVDEWEVAVMHRVHTTETAGDARVCWLEGDPDTTTEAIDAFRAAVPALETVPGIASASLLVDRKGGRFVSTVAYDSSAAMAKARAQESEIRTDIADRAGAYVIEVAEFQLAVSQLRVPELV